MRRIRDKITCNFKNYMMHDYIFLNSPKSSEFEELTKKISRILEIPNLVTNQFKKKKTLN